MELKNIGITPAKEKQFNKKGINNIEDLIGFFPRKYYDFTKETGILSSDQISCVVIHVKDVKYYNNSTPLIIANAVEEKTGKRINIMWFRQDYLFQNIYSTIGKLVYVCGKATYNPDYDNYSISGPLVYSVKINESKKVMPVYSKINRMSEDYLTDKINKALEFDELIYDKTPKRIVSLEKMIPLSDATKILHKPKSIEELTLAKKRLIFDDLLYFGLQMEMSNRDIPKKSSYGLESFRTVNKVIRERIPFELTVDQKKVLKDITERMKTHQGENILIPDNINALLHGECGAGKTLVAQILTIAMITGGVDFEKRGPLQVCITAPTNILLNQHVQSFLKLTKDMPEIKVAHYRGTSMKTKERKEMMEKIKNGEYNVIFGTHSVASLEFANLAMIFIDEEQKFGINFKLNMLKNKCNTDSFRMLMSGTPLPRTLGKLYYGSGDENSNMQLYTVKTLPGDRIPIRTIITKDDKNIFKLIKKESEEGRKTFVICPAIGEDDEESKLVTVNEISKYYNENLSKYGIKIDTLTGKDSKEEADRKMAEFERDGNVLIATTILETGVTVSKLSTIIIYGERLGLQSLWQLKCRVAREPGILGRCILYGEDDNPRYQIIRDSKDAFEVSEKDAEMRQYGNIRDYGSTNQHGTDKYLSLILENQEMYKRIKKYAPVIINDAETKEFIEYMMKKEKGEAEK